MIHPIEAINLSSTVPLEVSRCAKSVILPIDYMQTTTIAPLGAETSNSKGILIGALMILGLGTIIWYGVK